MKDDALHLRHILQCISRIERYTSGSEQAFLADEKTQDATLRNLQTLAESTQRLSATLKSTRPDVDWRSIAGFRNVVVHNYLGLDLGQVWAIVEHDLPRLKEAIQSLLRETG